MLITKELSHKDNRVTGNVPVAFKLADFGISQVLKSEKSRIKKKAGTRLYMAREYFKNQTYNPYKCDIFALGVLLFRLIYKAYPPSQVLLK